MAALAVVIGLGLNSGCGKKTQAASAPPPAPTVRAEPTPASPSQPVWEPQVRVKLPPPQEIPAEALPPYPAQPEPPAPEPAQRREIFAEVLKDVAFRLAPVMPSVAREMIEEIKGYPVLAGARGKPPADVDALAEAIVRLSALAVDLKDHVAELDINPLFVMEKGRGVKAADALIRLRS
jgi:hypothetical protein